MTTKSREYLFGSTVKAKAEQAATARKNADRLACEAWNARMLGFRGPAPPSPAIGDALNAGYGYLEVKLSRLQNASDDRARHHPSAEDDARARTRTLHAMQGLLAGARLSFQTEPVDRATVDKDIGRQSSLRDVARRAGLTDCEEAIPNASRPTTDIRVHPCSSGGAIW